MIRKIKNEITDSIMMKYIDGSNKQLWINWGVIRVSFKTDEKLDAENQIKNSQRVYNQEKTY